MTYGVDDYINNRNEFAVPEGKVLVHNNVAHTERTYTGTRGFRAWVQYPADNIVPCDCGYAGREHYRMRAADDE